MWRIVTPWFFGALSLALSSGCARPGPGPTRPTDLATPLTRDRTSRSPVVPLAVPGQGGRVSLRAILAYADNHAPEVRSAEGQLIRARAEREAASPFLREDPSVSLHAGPRWGPDGSSIDYGAAIEQTVEIAGERGLRIASADRSRDLARAELSEVRWQIHLRVHAAFHTALIARARVDLAERLLVFAERLIEVARQRLAAGDIAELQLRIAEGELALARQAKIMAEADYEAARYTLAALAGWPADQLPEPAGTLENPQPVPPLADLIALATRSHPELRSRTAATAEATARARLAERESWPKVTLGLSLERESGPDQSQEHIGLVTLRLPIPLWNRNRGDRARARADLTVARTEYDILRDRLPVRIAAANAAVSRAAARVEAYGADVIPSFEDGLTLLGRGFELGEIDMLELLVARGRFLELQHEVLDAHRDYFLAVARLEAEIGTEIWPDERHDDSKSNRSAPALPEENHHE